MCESIQLSRKRTIESSASMSVKWKCMMRLKEIRADSTRGFICRVHVDRSAIPEMLVFPRRRNQNCCCDSYRKSSISQVQHNLFVLRVTFAATANLQFAACPSEKRKKFIHAKRMRCAMDRFSLMTERLRYDISPVLLILIDDVACRAKSPRRLRGIPIGRFSCKFREELLLAVNLHVGLTISVSSTFASFVVISRGSSSRPFWFCELILFCRGKLSSWMMKLFEFSYVH